MKTKIAVIALTFMLASCIPAGILTPTKSIITNMVFPTKTDAPPALPIPTLTTQVISTLTSVPSLWQIWFRGFSCEGKEVCDAGPNQDLYYYSINSDGTELRMLQISGFPTPQLPNDAPPLPVAFATNPQISSDQSTLTYSAKDGDNYVLYIVDILTGKATRLYETKMIQDHLFWIGLACWGPNGQTIEFLLHSRFGNENQPPVLYTIDLDGNHLQALFSFPGLENAWFGACSPDGKELVLTIPGNMKVEENGIYLINRNTGHVRQILSNFFASIVQTP